jgi:peroxin-3
MLYLLTSSQLAILARTRYLHDIKTSLPMPPDEPVRHSSRAKEASPAVSRESSVEEPRPKPKSSWFGLGSFSIDAMGLSQFAEATLPTVISSNLPFLSQPATSTSWTPEVLAARKAREEEEKADAERLFLTYSWWLLHEGWRGVGARVELAVERVFGG